METQELNTVKEKIDGNIETTFIPTYVPTIEETFTASGAHRQML